MIAFEAPGTRAYGSPEYQDKRLHQAGAAILHFAGRVIDGIYSFVLPTTPRDGLSEHFGHAEKRNDPSPNIDLGRAR